MLTTDLRSDTVTHPTAAMWAAMRAAPLGDDVLGDDPTVRALEERIAALLGKEAALFVPSGTMANQLAIRTVCGAGDDIIAHRDSHIIHYETGAPAALSGAMVSAIDGAGGIFDAAAVHAAVRSDNVHHPRSRMLVIENTHNRGGGSVWPLAAFGAAAAAAHEHGLHVHTDGARIFNAAVATDCTAHAYAQHTDSISVCFSKGLGCPVGSALAAPAELIQRARRFRKMFGGGMRQSGMLAAAALWALDHHIARLADDHAHARRLAAGVEGIPGMALATAPSATPTNMVFLTLAAELGTAQAFCERLAHHGVRMIAMDPQRVRAVTHLDVDAAGIDRAIAAVHAVAKDARAGHGARAGGPKETANPRATPSQSTRPL